jgi:hypothetical protein
MDELEFAWPKPGAVLFSEPTELWSTACVNFANDDGYYSSAYKFCAERLFEVVQQTQRDQDFIVHPFVFLWRHSLELALKDLVPYVRALSGNLEGLKLNHGLVPLWEECRPFLQDHHPESFGLLDAVDTLIREFAVLDPTSTTFRYPHQKDGKPSLPADMRHINLRTFHETMLGILNFLGAAVDALDDRLQAERDMEAEFGGYEEAASDYY